jgi:hypothetical protein
MPRTSRDYYLVSLIPHDLWYQLLAIDQIAATAEQVVDMPLEEVRQQPRR